MGEFLGLYYQEHPNSARVLVNRKTTSGLRIAIKALSVGIKYFDMPLNDLLMVHEEYRRIFEAQDQQKAFDDYRQLLIHKHYQRLGVYIDK